MLYEGGDKEGEVEVEEIQLEFNGLEAEGHAAKP